MQVFALAGGAPAPDVAFDETYLLANFVRFWGYDELAVAPMTSTGPATGTTAVWQIYWQTADNPDPTDYHIFNHLLDGNGERVSQMDGDAFSGNQWLPGDVVVSRFVLPWDAGWKRPLTMRSGMYSFDTQEPVLLLDVAGNPYTDAVEIKIKE